METLNTILLLLDRQNKTQKELCEAIGVKKSTFSHWKSAENTSYKKYLPEIANFFNVSIDYLLGNTESEKKEPITMDRFSHDYYRLDTEDKETVDLLISTLLAKSKYKKENVG